MSDLQCAATVVVLPAGRAVDVEALRRERPALLLSGVGEVELADTLDLPVRRLVAKDERPALGHVTDLLREVADEYRGECVVVVVPEDVFAELRSQVLPTGSVAGAVLVQVDDDGHRWSSWPSAAPQ